MAFLASTLPHVSFCFSSVPILQTVIFNGVYDTGEKKQDH